MVRILTLPFFIMLSFNAVLVVNGCSYTIYGYCTKTIGKIIKKYKNLLKKFLQ